MKFGNYPSKQLNLAFFGKFMDIRRFDESYFLSDKNLIDYVSHKLKKLTSTDKLSFSFPHISRTLRENGFLFHSLSNSVKNLESALTNELPEAIVVEYDELVRTKNYLSNLKEKYGFPIIVVEEESNLKQDLSIVPDVKSVLKDLINPDYSIMSTNLSNNKSAFNEFIKQQFSFVDDVLIYDVDQSSLASHWTGDSLKSSFDRARNNSNKKNYLETLEYKLLSEGFSEEHAQYISKDLQNNLEVEIVDGEDVTVKSKNTVYYLNDVFGNKKTIKFYKNKKEATMEATVNYYFLADSELSQFVAGTKLSKPLEFTINNTTIYVVFERDVRGETLPDMFNPNSKHSRNIYFASWMKKLAVLHTKGTAIMNSIGNFDESQDLLRERDKDRIDLTFDTGTTRLIQEKYLESKFEEQVFINQDLKLQNRVGQKIVDWGNAGRGNPYVDVAMILNDPRVELSEDEKNYYVSLYLNFKSSYFSDSGIEKNYFLNKEFVAYKSSEYLLTTLLTSIYEQKGDIISPASNKFKNVLTDRQRVYAKQIVHPNGVETNYSLAS